MYKELNQALLANIPFIATHIHKKTGNPYMLIGVSNLDSERPGWEQQALYIDRERRLWSRPINEYIERRDPVGDWL